MATVTGDHRLIVSTSSARQEPSSGPAAAYGPLDLLVLQPTPFCNIDCAYCYLPDRGSRKRMTAEVLERIFQRVFESGLVQHPFTVIWHAGEPMVLPPAFYQSAISTIDRLNTTGFALGHSFQTNATLITGDWCDLLRAGRIAVGVSVDGPAFIHDAYRRTRKGAGTHAKVLRGMELLRDNGIPFHAITVLTSLSLDYPDELYDFYLDQEIRAIGFNVEEIEGPHRTSSLQREDIYQRYVDFMSRFIELVAGGSVPLQVREFSAAVGALGSGVSGGSLSESTPGIIISVDCEGNFTTYSPELLGLRSAEYGDFALGNVQSDGLIAGFESPKGRAIGREIRAGIERCRRTCNYFATCGGGAPVNKYYENGSFDSTETLFCRLTRQATLDAVLAKLEQGVSPSALLGKPG